MAYDYIFSNARKGREVHTESVDSICRDGMDTQVYDNTHKRIKI